jgi:ABC-2 type transport system ATP-binding protein
MQETVIEVAGLSKSFGTVQAVSDISFSVEKGATCALLGGNGAGKTTTLSMLLGLLLPTQGSIHILGMDMLRQRYDVLPRMNFTSPYVDLPMRLTVSENLMVYARLYSVPNARRRLQQLAEELDFAGFMNRPCATLSSGQRTRVALAKSLLNEPELLLLDEPTASMDPDTADRMRKYLLNYRQRTGASLLLASHNMQEVERLCDQVFMLREGKLVDQGTPTALIRRYSRDDLEQVFLDIARRTGGAA